MKVEDIILDEDIYPRQHTSQVTIESYAEALRSGAKFPSIEVQKIKDGGVVRVIVLDGLHRVEAYKLVNRAVIDARYWKDEVLDKVEALEDLRIRSLQANLKHGLRIGERDIGYQATRIVEDRPLEKLKGIGVFLAKKLDVTDTWISKLVGNVIRSRKQSRDSIIYGMSLSGWTQQEVAGVMGLSQPHVGEIIGKLPSQLFFKEHESGMSDDDIASQHSLTLPVLWSILLNGKSDLERFELLDLDNFPYLYDVWNFSGRDKRFGLEYPGNIPAGIVLNTLYYYTKQGDLVVDPMAGGGVTVDCCLAMGRKCRAYDITSVRKDIQINNILNGYPDVLKACDLVFVDPPYWSMRKEHYSKESVSSLSMKDYEAFISHLAGSSYKLLKKGGYLAFLIQNQTGRDLEELSFIDWAFRSVEKFKQVGFEYIWRIACPQSMQTATPQHVDGAKRKKRLLGLVRDLLIFRK